MLLLKAFLELVAVFTVVESFILGGKGDGEGQHFLEGIFHEVAKCQDNCLHGSCITLDTDIFHIVHECQCNAGYTGKSCETAMAQTQIQPSSTTSTMTPPTTQTTSTMAASTTQKSTPPTTIQSTQRPAQLHHTTCGKLATVNQIANQEQARNRSAAACASGSHTSPEAFTLRNCPLSVPAFWKQGDNVMTSCASGTIQLYIPIAVFGSSGYFSSSDRLSGVFIGCESQGFKMAVQKCDSFPMIEHLVIGGQITPQSFYVIKY